MCRIADLGHPMMRHVITWCSPAHPFGFGPDAAPRNTGYSSATPTGWHTRFVRYVTRIDRFQRGDFPMVCVRSGLPATKMVPVQARRTTVWPWFLLPISVIWFAIAKWSADTDHPWGQLPFAEGHVEGISATYEKSIGVIIEGAHPDFVAATRHAQGKTTDP